MKKTQTYALVTLLLAAAAGFIAHAATAQNPDGATRHITRWEHLALTHDGANMADGDLTKQIVHLGDQGWELVDVSTTTKADTAVTSVFFFKRPK